MHRTSWRFSLGEGGAQNIHFNCVQYHAYCNRSAFTIFVLPPPISVSFFPNGNYGTRVLVSRPLSLSPHFISLTPRFFFKDLPLGPTECQSSFTTVGYSAHRARVAPAPRIIRLTPSRGLRQGKVFFPPSCSIVLKPCSNDTGTLSCRS